MGARTYFFPPNADPIYHEITDQSIKWINGLYGAALAEEFDRRAIPYFNRDVYDLFYMGYRDTVPSTGFIADGMTFEKIRRRADIGTNATAVLDAMGLAIPGRTKQEIHSVRMGRGMAASLRAGREGAAGAERGRESRQRTA
jgi:hypothetical protein